MKAKRDYNKEPLVLKDYEPFMKWHTMIVFICIIPSLTITWVPMVSTPSDYNRLIRFVIYVLLFCPIIEVLLYYIFVIRGERKVKLYNNKIKFYKNGKFKKEHKFKKGEFSGFLKRISVEWYIEYIKKNKILAIFSIVFVISFWGIATVLGIILWIFLFIGYDRVVKQIIYYKSNGSLYNFTSYLQIGVGFYSIRFMGVYVCYFKNKDYISLKQYFLDIFDENLDEIYTSET